MGFCKAIRPSKTFDDVVFQLEPKLKDLVDLRGLFYFKQMLYKIDISESQVVHPIALEKDVQFFKVLAKLIFYRCLQKVMINYFKSYEKESLYKCLES